MDYLAIDSEVGCYTYGELFNQIVATAAGIISGWLWGVMAESYSWSTIITVWMIMAAVSVLCCFGATPLWKKFINTQGDKI